MEELLNYQDDLEAKLQSRSIGKKSSKSTMKKNCWAISSHKNPEIMMNNNKNLATQFDFDLVNSLGLNSLFYLRKEHLIMNNELLYDAEDLLQEYCIDTYQSKGIYGEKIITYNLPVTGQIDMYLDPNTRLKKDDDLFVFRGKNYDSSMIYRMNSDNCNNLKVVCSSTLEVPQSIPESIQLIKTSASDGEQHYNLTHSTNYTHTECTWSGYVHFEHDGEITPPLCTTHSKYILIKNKCLPIYVKINEKNKTKITHLGFLGSRMPVITYKRNKSSLRFERNNGNKSTKPFHILDTNIPISYVKKLEIWFRGSKTKKWNFLETIQLSSNGLTACYQEEIVPIFSHFNDLNGIELTELKIIPLEYVNNPTIRIACYGTMETQTNHKIKVDNDCKTIGYTIFKPDFSNKMIKNDNIFRPAVNHQGKLINKKNYKRCKKRKIEGEMNKQLNHMNDI
jgi:hypothetical protein